MTILDQNSHTILGIIQFNYHSVSLEFYRMQAYLKL